MDGFIGSLVIAFATMIIEGLIAFRVYGVGIGLRLAFNVFL